MGFTEWLESLTPVVNLVRVFAGLGLVTILLAYLKRIAERHRWQTYKSLVDDWMDRLIESENQHPNELTEIEWNAACERILTNAGFGPLEINQLLGTAIVVAKGMVADKMFI